MDYIIQEPAVIKHEVEALPGVAELLLNPDPIIRRAAELIQDRQEILAMEKVSLASVLKARPREDRRKILAADYVEFGGEDVTADAKNLLTKVSRFERLFEEVKRCKRSGEWCSDTEEKLTKLKKSAINVDALIAYGMYDYIGDEYTLTLRQVKNIIDSMRPCDRKHFFCLSMWDAIRTNDEVASLLAFSELKFWRVAAAERTRNLDLLTVLSTDKAQDVRMAVANNSDTSDELLRVLMTDSAKRVAKDARTELICRHRATRKAAEANEV